jgi:hypothetical protein
VVGASLVDLGATAATGTVRLTNPGGLPVGFTVDAGLGAAAFSASIPGGTLGAGQAVDVVFTVDRAPLAEGSHRRRFTVAAGDAGGGAVEVRATVERPPDVPFVRVRPTLSCPWSAPPSVSAAVSDESPNAGVTVSWSGPGPSGQSALTERAPGQWDGTAAIGRVNGTWTYVVRATDQRGNVGTASGTIVVTRC